MSDKASHGCAGNTGNILKPTTWSSFTPTIYKQSVENKEIEIIEHQETNLIDGKMYVNQISGLKLINDHNTATVITKDNIYSYGNFNSKYGNDLGSITVEQRNPNQLRWLIQPYSMINLTPTYTETFTFNVIDISGKKVIDFFKEFDYEKNSVVNSTQPFDIAYINGEILNPYHVSVKEFYEKIKDKTFPVGSQCLQLQELSYNEDFIYLNTYPEGSVAQSELIKQWDNASKDLNYHSLNLHNTQNYFRTINDISSGYLRYMNKYYEATKYKQGIEINRDDLVNQLLLLGTNPPQDGEDCKDLNDIAATVFLAALK